MHMTFAEIAREIVKRGYGKNGKNEDDAAQKVMGEGVDLAGVVLVELLMLFDRIGKAMHTPDVERKEEEEKEARKPANIKAFPGLKFGDVLYDCDELERGVGVNVVVAVEGDYVRVVCDWIQGNKAWVYWATDNYFLTAAEALEAQAKEDVAYYSPRLKLAQKVLKAVRSGDDLSRFIEGVDVDDED